MPFRHQPRRTALCGARREGISELTKGLTLVKQHNINIDIQNINLENIETFQAKALDLIEDGRVIIRQSGTEPLIRILIESDNEEIVNQINNLVKEITK